LVDVALDVLGVELLVVELVLRQGPDLGRLALAEEDDLVDLLPVGGEGQCDPEVLLRDQLAQLGVLDGLVEVKGDVVGVEAAHLEQLVTALRLVVDEDGLVRDLGEVADLEVELAADRAEQDGLEVGDDREHEPVDVRQLPALGVDLPEVGVAGHGHLGGAAGVGLLDHPGSRVGRSGLAHRAGTSMSPHF
jgi:hypothetical protein